MDLPISSQMGLIEKLENFINLLLTKLGELIYKLVPAPLKKLHDSYQAKKNQFILFLKSAPALLKPFTLNLIQKTKAKVVEYNFKAKLTETYQSALAQYKTKTSKGPGKVKSLLLAPFLIFSQWVKGLSPAQTLLLLSFTGLSVLSVIGIGFSGQRLAKNYLEVSREPASVIEEEVLYERPEYYKKQTRFFEINNLRLPIYFADVNELKSVDVDFIATISNRSTRQYLEKNEFRLRDHLIITIEPSVASFPLTDEGREIIRRKIQIEINEFLKENKIDGEATELKITYVLAN